MQTGTLSLECTVTAPDSFDIEGPMKVSVALRNAGPNAISLLAKSTVLSPQPHHYLVLEHGGEILSDRSPEAFEMGAEAEEVMRIPAGASVSKELDITDHYAVAEAGEYRLSIHMPVVAVLERDAKEMPAVDWASGPFMVESPAVAFAIRSDRLAPLRTSPADLSGGLAASAFTAAEAGGAFPDEPAEPTLTGLNTEQAAQYFDAHRWAYRSILAALAVMEAAPNQLVIDYIDGGAANGGTAFEDRRRKVITNLKAMAAQMTVKLTYRDASADVQCADGKVAYCYFGTPLLGLCSRAFDDGYLTRSYGNDPAWVRALIVVHELSHGVFKAQDVESRYSEDDCKYLARTNPNQAIWNAQNYALLAMHANPEPPEGRRPNTGIWGLRDLPTHSETSHNPALAALPEAGVIMMAYRDDNESKNGKLWTKALLAGPRGDVGDWQPDEPLRNAQGALCSSLREPALAAFPVMGGWHHMDPPPGGTWVHRNLQGLCCVYVEAETRRLALLEARQGRNGTPLVETMTARQWSEILWQPYPNLEKFPKSSAAYGPSLAFFEGRIFCLYVDESGELRCLSNTDVSIFGGVWDVVPIDSNYKPSSSPSMAVFDGRLRATLHVRTTLMMLEFKNDRWNYFASFEASGQDTLALAQWNTAKGPRLVGMGKVRSGNTLSYMVSNGDGAWQSSLDFWKPAHNLTLIASPTGAALVSCGGTLHALYRSENNEIRWMVAHPA